MRVGECLRECFCKRENVCVCVCMCVCECVSEKERESKCMYVCVVEIGMVVLVAFSG